MKAKQHILEDFPYPSPSLLPCIAPCSIPTARSHHQHIRKEKLGCWHHQYFL